MTADLYQACLIFHRRLVIQQRPSPGDQSATSQCGCQSSSGYGPLVTTGENPARADLFGIADISIDWILNICVGLLNGEMKIQWLPSLVVLPLIRNEAIVTENKTLYIIYPWQGQLPL